MVLAAVKSSAGVSTAPSHIECDASVAKGFRYAGDRAWNNGMIYDPDTGRTYRSRMHLTKQGVLKVRGYIGFPLLGNTTKLARPAEAKQTSS